MKPDKKHLNHNNNKKDFIHNSDDAKGNKKRKHEVNDSHESGEPHDAIANKKFHQTDNITNFKELFTQVETNEDSSLVTIQDDKQEKSMLVKANQVSGDAMIINTHASSFNPTLILNDGSFEKPTQRRNSNEMNKIILKSTSLETLPNSQNAQALYETPRKSFSLDTIVINKHELANSQPFADTVDKYCEYLIKLNYEPLIHIPTTGIDIKSAQPISDGRTTFENSRREGYGRAARFFSKNDGENKKALYAASTLQMLKMNVTIEDNIGNQNNPTFKPLPDGVFVFVIVLVKNFQDDILKMELRAIPKGDGGHPSLMLPKELEEKSISLIAAGEGYYLKSKGGIIMINDKTGNYYQYLQKLGVSQQAIADKFFKPYAAAQNQDNYFYSTSANEKGYSDKEIVIELIKRGLPYDLLPGDLKKKVSFTSLEKSIADQAVQNKKEFDLFNNAKQPLPNINVNEHTHINKVPQATETCYIKQHSIFPENKSSVDKVNQDNEPTIPTKNFNLND